MARASLFLVVQIRAGAIRWPLVLAVPLGFVRDVLAGFGLVWWFCRRLGLEARLHEVWRRRWPAAGFLEPGGPLPMNHDVLLKLARAVEALRREGPFTLAEVEDGATRVRIGLW